jgi:putative colanic acid biosynthesis glycosyltransferase WcaI
MTTASYWRLRALVTMQRNVAANVNRPSKIGSYLAVGRPILGSIRLDTPAAEMLRASGAAIIVAPEDASALSTAMQVLCGDAHLRSRLGAPDRRHAEQELGKRRILEKLERAFVGR